MEEIIELSSCQIKLKVFGKGSSGLICLPGYGQKVQDFIPLMSEDQMLIFLPLPSEDEWRLSNDSESDFQSSFAQSSGPDFALPDFALNESFWKELGELLIEKLLLEKYKVKRIHLIGVSIGCRLALFWASRLSFPYTKVLSKITLVAPEGIPWLLWIRIWYALSPIFYFLVKTSSYPFLMNQVGRLLISMKFDPLLMHEFTKLKDQPVKLKKVFDLWKAYQSLKISKQDWGQIRLLELPLQVFASSKDKVVSSKFFLKQNNTRSYTVEDCLCNHYQVFHKFLYSYSDMSIQDQKNVI